MLSSLFLLTFATALTIESFSIDKSVHLNYPEKASKSIRDKSTFTLKLSAPAEQVFLALVNPTNPDSTTTFAFSSTSGSSYSFVLDLNNKPTLELLRGVPGTYKPTLFISNDNETPLSYQFGTLDLVFQENKDLGKPANEDQEYSILNEITHVYRKPEVRPPSIISLLFSGLVLSPWLFLFYAFNSIGFNFGNFRGKLKGYGVFFFSSLAAFCGLYGLYFWFLNIFQLMAYGSIVGTLVLYFGWKTLVARANVRLITEKKNLKIE